MVRVLAKMKKAKHKLKEKRQHFTNERYVLLKRDNDAMKREIVQLRQGIEQEKRKKKHRDIF